MTTRLTGVVLLEGPDGAGKTTLAEHLCKKYDGHYVHRTWHKGMDVWSHHSEALEIANERSANQLVVIDRLWPSEAIYGRVFRKESDYKHNSRAMDRVLLRFATINVLCVPPVEYVVDVHARKAREGLEMYSSVEQVAKLYDRWAYGTGLVFDAAGDIIEQQASLGGFANIRRDALVYDVTKDGADLERYSELLEEKLRWRQSKQFKFALDSKTPNILGHKEDADFIFVGEQLGDLHTWSRWPFYARSHSPDFLNRSLHEITYEEPRGLWTNAWDEDNRLPQIWNERDKDYRVIALGRKAERRCEALKIPVHAMVPHPSWARRFNHYGQRGELYSDTLKKALS